MRNIAGPPTINHDKLLRSFPGAVAIQSERWVRYLFLFLCLIKSAQRDGGGIVAGETELILL